MPSARRNLYSSVQFASLLDMNLENRSCTRSTIFGMDGVVPILQTDLQFPRTVAEERFGAFTPPHLVRLQVDLPKRVLSGVGNAAQALFAGARRLRLPASGR